MKVSIICVSTICGRIEPPGIGSPADRLRLEKARACTQASLLGASSLRKSDPEMRCSAGLIPDARIRAIITGSGDIPFDRKIFHHGPAPVIFTSDHGYARLSEEIRRSARVHVLRPAAQGGLCLRQALDVLAGCGVTDMLIEGGGRLNFHALQQGVVDEILLTLAPKITGCDNMAMFFCGNGHVGNPFVKCELAEVEHLRDSDELFLRYRVAALQ